MARSPQIHIKHPNEVRNVAVSFANVLDQGELLTGTPAVTSTPVGLTFGNVQVNSTAVTVNGTSVAAGQAVLASVSGGTSGTEYQFETQCGTTASVPQTLVIESTLQVLDQVS